MKDCSWTWRIAFFGFGVLAVAAVFVFVVRLLGVSVAGIQPGALVMVMMMTAPFTVGFVTLFTLLVWGVEVLVRRLRPSGV